MLDGKEIDAEISRLEYIESSYSNYSKLADLYIIRDRMNKNNILEEEYDVKHSYKPSEENVLGSYGDSEFMHMITGKNISDILKVMDDLMDRLRIANQKVYRSVLMKIEGI